MLNVSFRSTERQTPIIGATLGFKSMKTAYATIKGIEVMRALRKGQASAFYYGDPLGEMRLVSRVFEM
ncbi:transposase%2C IS26 [Escherichia coli]|nr:transposase%2C IS26 [Escherichia coli]